MGRSGMIALFKAFVRASLRNPYTAKIGVWIGCVRRINMIPEVFFSKQNMC